MSISTNPPYFVVSALNMIYIFYHFKKFHVASATATAVFIDMDIVVDVITFNLDIKVMKDIDWLVGRQRLLKRLVFVGQLRAYVGYKRRLICIRF